MAHCKFSLNSFWSKFLNSMCQIFFFIRFWRCQIGALKVWFQSKKTASLSKAWRTANSVWTAFGANSWIHCVILLQNNLLSVRYIGSRLTRDGRRRLRPLPTCMSYIMDSVQNKVYTTFPNIFSLLSADFYRFIIHPKNHFHEKIPYFLIENVLQKDQNWLYKKTTVVPSPHKHFLQTHKSRFSI